MLRRGVLLLLCTSACGSDHTLGPALEPVPDAAFETVCTSEGPQRLLALGAGEHAYGVDRVAAAAVLVSTFFVDPSLPLASLPPTLDLAIHAVGPCGEAPHELARGLVLTGGYDDLVLACREGGHGALVLDLDAGAPPRPLLEAWCPLRSTDAGLLAVESEPDERYGTLVLLRDPSDPQAEPEVLAERIRTSRNTFFGAGPSSTTSLWAQGGEAVVLTEDGVVLRLELATGQATPELEGVRELRVSSDGRSMIWQGLEPAVGDSDTPLGPVFVRDRESQTDAHLLDTHLEWTGNPFASALHLALRDDTEGLRLFWRDDAEPLALPEGTDYRGVLDDGALWLVRRVDGGTEELRWSPGDPQPELLVRHDGVVSRAGDGFEIFDVHDVPAPNEGSLGFQSFDGRPLVRLADHVHASHGRLRDGRILTIVNEDASEHGSLRLIDPEDGHEVQLDPRGYVQSPRLSRGDPFDGDVVFASDGGVVDAERGVYRARVPREP